MTNPTPNTPGRSKPKRGRAAWYALLLVAAAGGIYVGTRWHSKIAPMLGMRAADGGSASEGDVKRSGTKQLWTCGMHPQVIQDKPGDCPICHMKLTPLKVDSGGMPADHDRGAVAQGGISDSPGTGGTSAGAQNRKVKYWWDPMLNPPYISDKPGKSPMGMDLIPVYEEGDSGAPGAVVIDPAVVQNMGVRIALVSEGPLEKSVRLVGYLDEAQPNIHDINLRVSGWIRRLYANTEGMHLRAGDPLFDLYSPELQVAVEELIAARRARSAADAGGANSQGFPDIATTLSDAAMQKLELVGLARAQIDALAKLDKAPETITFTSPVTGHLTERLVVEGAAVKMGDRVLRIVDHSTLWIDAQVFEKDLPFVKVGQSATATIASRAVDGTIEGEIIFVHPHVDMMTRAALVRMAIPNPSMTLKPGMYATVRTQSRIAERVILAPREAIIDTGESQMSFVAQNVGRFEPRKVKMGVTADDGMVQVIEGLAPGEAVVTSGQFLLDSESRLREAIQKFLNEKQQMSRTTPTPPATQGEAARSAPGAASSDGAAAALSPDAQHKLDAVATEYLKLSAALGKPQENGAPLDLGALITAAHSLHGTVLGTKHEPLAVAVAKAAEAMKGHPLDHQRPMFSALGEKVIALADSFPPSPAVAGEGRTLYVMNCPMAPGGVKGDWIQTSPDVANPFFATDMKECGSQVRTIDTRRK